MKSVIIPRARVGAQVQRVMGDHYRKNIVAPRDDQRNYGNNLRNRGKRGGRTIPAKCCLSDNRFVRDA